MRSISATFRGDAQGVLELSTEIGGEKIGEITISPSESWMDAAASVSVENGVHALYLTFKGTGLMDLSAIAFM